MQSITIKIEDSSLSFFIDLLKKFSFVTEIQAPKMVDKTLNQKFVSPIRLPKGKPSLTDFAGIWSENPKTLEQIREKAWKRI